MLSTLDLLIKVACLVKDANFNFNIIVSSCKLVRTKEVNCTEPSPSVQDRALKLMPISLTIYIVMIVMNIVTTKAAAKPKLLFNKAASGCGWQA